MMGVTEMKHKNLLTKIMILLIFSLAFIPIRYEVGHVHAFSNQVIQQGAVGEDVIELQARLQYLGFYNGKIDGVFGWRTYWALRNFQYEFGMKVDGLAGEKTKEKLQKASKYHREFVHENLRKGNKFTHYGGVDLKKQTKKQTAKQGQPQTPPSTKQQQTPAKQQAPPAKQQQKSPAKQQPAPPKQQAPQKQQTAPAKPTPTAVNSPGGFSQNDIRLMANAVHGESRGEPYIGQVAVAAVILNRIQSASFPNTVSGVIFEPGAFTAVADGQIWLTPNETSKRAVVDAINGWDPTGNAIYYFNPDTATSSWIWSRPQIKKIGEHIFCK